MSLHIIRSFVALGMVAILVLSLMTVSLRFYHRATSDVVYVRSGMGGQKVVMSGGTLVVPGLQVATPVSLATRRMMIRRNADNAPITLDGVAVELEATIWLRVRPTPTGIEQAARSLGSLNLQPAMLRELLAGKMSETIRAVTAQRSSRDVAEQSNGYIAQLKAALSDDLWGNGLEIEGVAIKAGSLSSPSPPPVLQADGGTVINLFKPSVGGQTTPAGTPEDAKS